MSVKLMLGDCLEKMAEIEDSSVDAIITDPPYPEIDRPYGRMTEAEWHSMMDRLIPECRRVLRPTGSAVFVLQPNYETPGRMRSWLWEFMAKWSREWNQVQDVWWWNITAIPTSGCQRNYGLTRASLKACVWLGGVECFRRQDEVLWTESDSNKAHRASGRALRSDRICYSDSGKGNNEATMRVASAERGGTTPFNVLPIMGGRNKVPGSGHGGATPMELADWWVRYISPPDGVVLDPFVGSGTVSLAALAQGRSAIGIERDPTYFATASARIAAAQSASPLFAEA